MRNRLIMELLDIETKDVVIRQMDDPMTDELIFEIRIQKYELEENKGDVKNGKY